MELTVRTLRRRWKPVKEKLARQRSDHPTNVRFHRACSWLQRVEQMPDGEDLDLRLTCLWIAFNALYGQWDERRAEPRADRECWREFLGIMLDLDAGEHLKRFLVDGRDEVLGILDDAYLAGFFWRDPSSQRAQRTTRDRRQAAGWYVEEKWSMVLESLVEHIYLLRCQLLHGASTYGSKLNRQSLQRCVEVLHQLLVAFLQIWVEAGDRRSWGPMCYPPVD